MTVPPLPPLPIDPVLPELLDALRTRGVAVLQAPPGAGKTTRVPLALLEQDWLSGRKIIVVEPRRLAARAAAHRMAAMLGQEVGETVGYREHAQRTCLSNWLRSPNRRRARAVGVTRLACVAHYAPEGNNSKSAIPNTMR